MMFLGAVVCVGKCKVDLVGATRTENDAMSRLVHCNKFDWHGICVTQKVQLV